MKRFLTLLVPALLLLAACTGTGVATPEEAARSSSIPTDTSTSSVRETQNVSYQGILEAAGIGITMQGTHQLRLSDGRFILLESEDIDLDPSMGKKVGVFGATRPTVEGNGTIMRVEEVILLEEESESSSLETSSAPVMEPPSSAAASSVLARSEAPRSAASASVAAVSTTDPVPEDLAARAAAMTKDNMDSAHWTQQYCTSHIGFCLPIHRNWWFKSFGATTSSLWHVEISNAAIQNLNEGPIMVKLLSGTSASKKATSGQVRIQGNWVVGLRDWESNEHFEITAPANLEAAVSYITEHLTVEQQH